jgi:hypothetical protein
VSTALVPDPAAEPTMNVDKVAKAFHISRAKAYEAVKLGDIPSIKLGRRLVVPRRLYAACSSWTAVPTQHEPKSQPPAGWAGGR